MYKDVKKNGNKGGDGYGDAPVYEIVAPSSTAMKLNADASYYQTEWFSVKSSGNLVSRTIQLSGAPEGTEIVYKDSNSNTSKFYLRIPVEKAYAIGDQKVSFKVKATAKFSRPFTYMYESLIADAQNITFLEKKTTNAPKSSEADVSIKLDALEDVKAADGESEDYYKKDELVGTITTDETGCAKLEKLPLGKYYVKEKETADGYVLDGEIREIDLTYRNQDTPVVTFSKDWQNKRQRAEVSVLKKEKDSDRVLEGAVFALCTKEDILGADGSVLMKADTVIEEKATDKEGKLLFTADLPIGYTYYVKETAPAPGFATNAEVQEFTFQYEGADKEMVSYEFTFEDEPTVFEFTKTALTTGKEVEGAKLQITDEEGTVIDEWVSGKEPHIIRELVVGKTYTMTETKPADGYVTAESIVFTVEDTAEVQKVEMKDDVTKVEISKTDIAGKELPGAKLTILNEEGKVVESWISGKEPHYIEMLPIGKYVLHEETAPEGYLVAEDVSFEVKDTAEIQKVQMKDEAEPKKDVPQDYVDKKQLYVVAGFFRLNPSGTLITMDTRDFQLEDKQGNWIATDEIIVDGRQFFLMQSEQFGAKAAFLVVSAEGNLVTDDCYNGFDETALQQIKNFLHPSVSEQPISHKPELEVWQKAYENGEYLRSAEMTEEANYNFIDGRINNTYGKKKDIDPKHRPSVLAVLHRKQKEIAARSGKQPQQIQEAERNRK